MFGTHPDFPDFGGFTSFATPRFSVEAAKFLNQAPEVDMTCGGQPIDPPLGYNDEELSSFKNLSLEDAVGSFCAETWIIR